MATRIDLVGGPAPYREALAATLRGSGFDVGAERPDATVIYCGREEDWYQVADTALWSPTVAVLESHALHAFVRALALGAGAMHIDTSTDRMLNVVQAAISGELRIPLVIGEAMASNIAPGQERREVQLDDAEQKLADALLEGKTIRELSSELNYSDRTIGRRLQKIYLKLNVESRAEAIRELRRRSGSAHPATETPADRRMAPRRRPDGPF